MVTKGIITALDKSSNKCTVRVPLFEIAGNEYQNQIDAIFAIPPGVFNGYNVDDVVLIAFENSNIGRGVVIGKLYLGAKEETNTSFSGAVQCNDLTVTNKAILPADTQITFDIDNSVVQNGAIALSSYNSISDIISNIRNLNQEILKLANGELDTYNVNESRIGTWVDGRHIFRKTIMFDFEAEEIGQTKNANWSAEIPITTKNIFSVSLIDNRSIIETSNEKIEASRNITLDKNTMKIKVSGKTGDYTLTTGYFTIEYIKNNV